MAIKIEQINEAREILSGVIVETPVIEDERLSNEIGAKAYLKAECLQKSGSFKIRGAYNKIHRFSLEEMKRGVVTGSAGNHAQGVALAAKLHNINATIVMPKHAPLTKVIATKNLGAEVILHGETFDEAVAHSRELQAEKGYIYVHAFDDDEIIAGQGTIGLEILKQLPDVDVIVVPVGGGGVISGTAIAAKSLNSKIRVVGVQAENCAPMKPSLAKGKPVEINYQSTIADGIAVKRPGLKTLEIIGQYVDEIVTVSEDEIARGIHHCVQNARLVVEGAGAAGLAALLANKIKVKPDQKVCTVLCGGNIDANLLARILEQVLVRQGRYILLKLLVVDRPGMLATLLNHVADSTANVIEVFHRRAMWLAPLGRVGIEILLEVRDDDHAKSVVIHLQKVGYHVEREGVGDWEE